MIKNVLIERLNCSERDSEHKVNNVSMHLPRLMGYN